MSHPTPKSDFRTNRKHISWLSFKHVYHHSVNGVEVFFFYQHVKQKPKTISKQDVVFIDSGLLLLFPVAFNNQKTNIFGYTWSNNAGFQSGRKTNRRAEELEEEDEDIKTKKPMMPHMSHVWVKMPQCLSWSQPCSPNSTTEEHSDKLVLLD